MKFEEFAQNNNLNEVLSFDAEKKVEIDYFKHNIVRNETEEYTVVTLSKDFTLYLSSLESEARYKFVKAMYDHYNRNDCSILHLVHLNKHLLITLVHGSVIPTLHVEQRAN